MTRAGFVLRQVKARPFRTAVTCLAFAITIGLLGFLILLESALRQEWSPFQAQRIIITAKTSFFDRLPMAYLPKIEAVTGVADVAPFDFVLGFYRNNRPENQIPVQAAPGPNLINIYKEAKIPQQQAQEWLADPTGGLIGPILARKFGWKPGDRITVMAPVAGGAFETTIRAVMEYNLDNGLYLHRRYFESLTGEKGQAAMFWVLARSRDEIGRITKDLEIAFDNAPVPVLAMTEKQWQLQFLQMLGNVKLLLGSIGLATAFTLLLITSNSLAMSARERRAECALLRILGFSRLDIALFLMGEAMVYGVAGAIAGSSLMAGFAFFVGRALDNTQWAGVSGLLVPTPGTVLMAIVSAVVIAMLSAVIPAFGVSRKPIVQLLRSQA